MIPVCSILPWSKRAEEWRKVFGRMTDIPIKDWRPTRADLPGKPNALIYELDLKRITLMEWCRLAEHIAQKFNLPLDEVKAGMEKDGVPILADDTIVEVPLFVDVEEE